MRAKKSASVSVRKTKTQTQTKTKKHVKPTTPKANVVFAKANNKKESTAFTKGEFQEFEKIIREKMAETKDLMRYHLEALRNNATRPGIEAGNEVVTQNTESELLWRSKKHLDHLENALTRMKNGTYGICQSCPETHFIDRSRLRLAPHATRCVVAKDNRDKIAGKGYFLQAQIVQLSA